MIPLAMNPWVLLGGAVVAAGIGFSSGWAINGWRLESNVAKLERDNAVDRAASANAALDQLAGRVQTMNTQSTAAQLDISTMNTKMDQIIRGQKNVQAAKPLPVDCAPDTGRLRSLREAVGAANAAIKGATAGPRAGDAVQGAERP